MAICETTKLLKQKLEKATSVSLDYDKNNILNRYFCESCVVFDMANEGRIIACRSRLKHIKKGESFYGYLTEEIIIC